MQRTKAGGKIRSQAPQRHAKCILRSGSARDTVQMARVRPNLGCKHYLFEVQPHEQSPAFLRAIIVEDTKTTLDEHIDASHYAR